MYVQLKEIASWSVIKFRKETSHNFWLAFVRFYQKPPLDEAVAVASSEPTPIVPNVKL